MLELFREYYNHSRTHESLDGNTPAEISGDSVRHPAPLHVTPGKSIAAVYCNFRLPLELQFAMHRLKVIAHSGEALFYQIHHFDELSGADVILVHRLLKNSEAADEYLMLTEQAYADIEFPCTLPVIEGSESYEHLGQIKTFIYKPYRLTAQ